jgi:hypothetical protein
MDERVECYSLGCLKPPAGLLEGHFYCRGHFVVTCYAKLDYCSELLRNRSFSEETFEAIRRFLAECTEQAARLSETAKDLNNIERARLLDILFYASDVGSHMRRSPRKTLTIPVRIHCNTPGNLWQEKTVTRSVSRYGGMFECLSTIKPDDVLVVEHIEFGRFVNARMVWGWRARAGAFVAGLEFVNCSNFWELDWNEPSVSSVPPEPCPLLQDVPKDSAQ